MRWFKSKSLVAFFLVVLLISSSVGPTVWAQSGGGVASPVAPQSTVLDPGAQPSAALGQVTEPCRPLNLNLSTGQSAEGAADPNWRLARLRVTDTFGVAYTVAPNREWSTPSSGGWISPFPKDNTGPGGVYFYETTFEINPSYINVILAIVLYAGDKQVSLFLDGKHIGEVATASVLKGPLTIPITSGRHTLNANVFNIAIPNDNNQPDLSPSSTGLLVSARVTAVCGGPFTAPPLTPIPLLPGISPSSVEQTLRPGASTRIDKKVLTAEVPPAPDIVFLADTTASMGLAIAGVQSGIGQIMTTVLASAPTAAFGVAQYKDVGDIFIYNLDQAVTTSTAAISTAVATWGASGGGNIPEAQLNALHELATNPATGWRLPLAGHNRIIVWFSDARGNDPSNGQTLASVIADLTTGPNKPILVIAIDVSGGNALDSTGQATAITTATGGDLRSGVNPSAIAATIMDALTTLPVTVSMTSNCAAPITTTFTPASVTVTSGGTVAFTETISVAAGAAPGDYSCDDWALIGGVPMTDGKGNVIKEQKLIHVKSETPSPTTTYIYSVKLVCGAVASPSKPSIPTLRDPAPVVPGLYRTAVNIHNFWEKDTTFLQKVAIALPQDQPRGPVTKKIQAKLGPNQAVEVDCHNVVAILEGTTAAKAEFLKGFVVIESPVELEVTAVYTAEELQENGISIDVEQIQPHIIRRGEVRSAVAEADKCPPVCIGDTKEAPLPTATREAPTAPSGTQQPRVTGVPTPTPTPAGIIHRINPYPGPEGAGETKVTGAPTPTPTPAAIQGVPIIIIPPIVENRAAPPTPPPTPTPARAPATVARPTSTPVVIAQPTRTPIVGDAGSIAAPTPLPGPTGAPVVGPPAGSTSAPTPTPTPAPAGTLNPVPRDFTREAPRPTPTPTPVATQPAPVPRGGVGCSRPASGNLPTDKPNLGAGLIVFGLAIGGASVIGWRKRRQR